MSASRIENVLAVLSKHKVECIIVGGVAAVIQGAPVATFDLDLVHARTSENIGRLLAALDELDAVYRAQAERRPKPAASHLSSEGRQLLVCRYGPVDFLGTIEGGRGYDELLPETEAVEVGSASFRVLRLEALVRLKEEASDPKYARVLEVLGRTLEEKRRADRPGR